MASGRNIDFYWIAENQGCLNIMAVGKLFLFDPVSSIGRKHCRLSILSWLVISNKEQLALQPSTGNLNWVMRLLPANLRIMPHWVPLAWSRLSTNTHGPSGPYCFPRHIVDSVTLSSNAAGDAVVPKAHYGDNYNILHLFEVISAQDAILLGAGIT